MYGSGQKMGGKKLGSSSACLGVAGLRDVFISEGLCYVVCSM